MGLQQNSISANDGVAGVLKYFQKVFTAAQHRSLDTQLYSPITFDERLTFWLQREQSLPSAYAFAGVYACAIA